MSIYFRLGWGELTNRQLTEAIGAIRRCIDFVDFFSGAGNYHKALVKLGYVGEKYDVAQQKIRNNMASPTGMACALWMVLSVVVGGVIGGGFPCHTWGWMARYTTKRSKDRPYGDETRPDVCEANVLTCVVAKLSRIATLRGVYWWWEQPGSTIAFACCWWVDLLRLTRTATRVYFWMRSYKHPLMKPSVLQGTLPRLPSVKLRKPKNEFKGSGQGYWEKRGKWVCGTKLLKSSQVYTPEFAAKMAQLLARTGLKPGTGGGEFSLPRTWTFLDVGSDDGGVPEGGGVDGEGSGVDDEGSGFDDEGCAVDEGSTVHEGGAEPHLSLSNDEDERKEAGPLRIPSEKPGHILVKVGTEWYETREAEGEEEEEEQEEEGQEKDDEAWYGTSAGTLYDWEAEQIKQEEEEEEKKKREKEEAEKIDVISIESDSDGPRKGNHIGFVEDIADQLHAMGEAASSALKSVGAGDSASPKKPKRKRITDVFPNFFPGSARAREYGGGSSL